MSDHERAQLRLACLRLAASNLGAEAPADAVAAYAKTLADFVIKGQASGEP